MIVPYSHNEHYETVKGWLAQKDIRISPKSMFSDIGFVVDNVAVGFLYLTNSGKSFIDQIAADPLVSKETRSTALDILINALSARAAEEGAQTVQTFINEPLVGRFLKHGYTACGEYTFLIK